MTRATSILSILLTTFASMPAVCAADWPMLGNTASRSGSTIDEVRPPFARKWFRAFPDEGIMTGVQPVIADGRVFIGTLRGRMYAIDAETGVNAWRMPGGAYAAGGAILHAAAVDDGRVFFGAADGAVYALNAANGRLLWSVQTGAAVWNAPAVHGGLVLIGSRDGSLYCINAESGDVKWKAPTGGPILCSPAVDARVNRVYIASEDMCVYAFDLGTGRLIWKSAKFPGASFRGYHPVIAPDGSVMVTVTPCTGADTIQNIMLDMVREVFGNFSSWRIKDEAEKRRIREANFELMKDPATYQRQLDYLRKRLADEPAFQTFFVLDPASGQQKFVTPIVYAESMNGPCSPAVVTPDGRVIVKYSALLRSRYEHYSPFLNVGYLDTATGHITPIMDQSRTYGWYDSLLLIHDEQSQLVVGGRMLINTHQDNVNAMNLDTLRGDPQPWAHNVHEVRPGVAASIWAHYLRDGTIPMGWEWLARGTAVYGGGSIIDVPIAISGDSFYYLPTHEINSGCVLLAYRMDPNGDAGRKAPEPTEKITDEQWRAIQGLNWDWDMLTTPRLTHVMSGLPGRVPGTLQQPLTDKARAAVERIADGAIDPFIWGVPERRPADPGRFADRQAQLSAAVEELISTQWRPLLFPSGKAPDTTHRLFVEPTETLYTLALAYPHLPPQLQERVRAHVARLSEGGGPLSGLRGRDAYDPEVGQVRTLFDPAPARLQRIANDVTRSPTARLYPLWLWAHTTGDWSRLQRDWPALRQTIDDRPARGEADCGNSRLAGLIAACRIARRLDDQSTLQSLLPRTRAAMRQRIEYELAHTEGGLMTPLPPPGTSFGRWHFLTPEVARFIRYHAGDVHRRLMRVYVDHHRPTWWLAWNVEMMWRNETNLMYPAVAMQVFAARAMLLTEGPDALAGYLDIPWCRGDEYHIQKLALLLNSAIEASWKSLP